MATSATGNVEKIISVKFDSQQAVRGIMSLNQQLEQNNADLRNALNAAQVLQRETLAKIPAALPAGAALPGAPVPSGSPAGGRHPGSWTREPPPASSRQLPP